MASALLVIDMQEEVLEGCADAAGVVTRINELSRRAAAARAPVIFIQHEAEDELVRGTRGWELASGLERPQDAFVVPKTYRDAFADTELEALLERLGVRRLVVTGAHSDFCVQTSALGAAMRGYDVALVSDAHTTVRSPENPALSGEAITAFVNARFATLRHPGCTVEVLTAAEVEFAAERAATSGASSASRTAPH